MIRYLNLGEYLWLSEQVTRIDAVVLSKASRADLADSALHAPEASFGGIEFYETLPDKAAVLVCRLAWNHPLPDGNKRAAWAALVMFLDLNGARWDPDPPDTDEAERRCWRSQPTRSTRRGPPAGFALASTSRSPANRDPSGQ